MEAMEGDMSEQMLASARKAIRELSTQERRDLRSELSALIALGKNVPEPAPDNQVEDLAGLVNTTLQEQGFEFMSTQRLRSYCKDYRGVTARLWAFARSAMPYSQRPEQMALLRLGIRMLAKNIEELQIPLTHATLMRQLERLPAVVNRGFPGYAQAGLLGMVVRDRLHA